MQVLILRQGEAAATSERKSSRSQTRLVILSEVVVREAGNNAVEGSLISFHCNTCGTQ